MMVPRTIKLRFAGLVFMAGLLPVCALPGVSRWLKFAGDVVNPAVWAYYMAGSTSRRRIGNELHEARNEMHLVVHELPF
jgi:hypothetical protein